MLRQLKLVLLVTAMLIVLGVVGVFAQSDGSRTALLTLTEADVNASFQFPGPNSVAVGDVNLDGVDLLATGEVQISFSATVRGADGQDQSLNIIAILIGVMRTRGTVYQLQQATITNVTDGTSNTIMFGEIEARHYSFVANAFNRYLRSEMQEAGIRGRTETVNNDETITIYAAPRSS